MKEIYDLVIESVGDNRDTLTEIMERLSEYELFASRVNDPSIFLNNNYYFSLSGELDSTVRFTSIFLIINYIFNVFTNMGGTEVIDGNRSMRYVLMIDEAHDLFREKSLWRFWKFYLENSLIWSLYSSSLSRYIRV